VGLAQEVAPEVNLAALSDDAKAILGAHFGLMITPGKGRLTFQTPWNRTARAIAALDELVREGVLSVVDGEEGRWARTYRALVNCGPAFHWCSKNRDKLVGFAVMVPHSQRRELPPRGWQKLGPEAAPKASPLGTARVPGGNTTHSGSPK
jgi:hypothetical protein